MMLQRIVFFPPPSIFLVGQNLCLYSLLLIFLFSQIAHSQNAQNQDAPGAIALKLNEPIESKIAGGQKHVYKLALAAREYAKVSVEQTGVDLAVRVVGADGKTFDQFDSDIRKNGAETVEYAALNQAEELTLEVEAKPKDAAAADYKISLIETRPATENDFALQESRRQFADAVNLSRSGKFKEADARAESALEIREKILGAESYEVAIVLNRMAIISFNLGDNAKSETLFKRALNIYAKYPQANQLDTGDALNNLATLLRIKGNFAEAEKLLLSSLAIREKWLGRDNDFVAGAFNNLGTVYSDRGDTANALKMYEQSLEIRERLFGADSREAGNTLVNLARLYYYKGDYATALKLATRVLEIREKKLPAGHPEIAVALGNAGLAAFANGDLEKAESLYLRALAIDEKNFGADNIEVDVPLGSLAQLYAKREDFEKADSTFKRVLQIAEKNLDGESVQLAFYLLAAGEFYTDKADYEKAETYLKRAFEIRRKTLGSEHAEVGRACSLLARMYLLENDAAQAFEFQKCADRIEEKNIALNLFVGTEHEKLSYMKLLADDLNQTINLQIALPENKAALEQAAATVVQRKGRVLDAMAANLSDLRRRFDAQDQILLQKLNDTNAAFAQLSLNKPPNLSLEEYQKQIDAFQAQKDKLESEISRQSRGFFEPPKPSTLAEVRNAIPPDAALVEFSLYRTLDKKDGEKIVKGESRYAVYVVRNQGEIRAATLGAAAEIDQAIDAYRKSLRDAKGKNFQSAAKTVYEKLIKPIEPFLSGAAHLLISPDGELNLIPFEALVDERNHYLIENYSFTYLTSGRDLLRMQTARASKGKSLIVANPMFGAAQTEQTIAANQSRKPAARDNKRRSVTGARNMSETYFAPIQGTTEEALSIQALFPDALFLTGAQATETALKQTVAPQILHIATHGFFLEDNDSASDKSTPTRDAKTNVETENPLLRSGLALAGANRRDAGSGSDDGVLTALEASGLNLWGTKLVVLSACDTGLGEIKNGEGVYGLRRSFVLAGAESMVMSLWSVSDYATRELMTNYYKNLKKGMGRGAALRAVQLDMLKRKERAHPFYWAGFIQSGEWANLGGKR